MVSDQLKDIEGAYNELSTCIDELMQILDDEEDEAKQSDAKLADSYTNLCSVRDKIHKLKAKDKSDSTGDTSSPTCGILIYKETHQSKSIKHKQCLQLLR